LKYGLWSAGTFSWFFLSLWINSENKANSTHTAILSIHLWSFYVLVLISILKIIILISYFLYTADTPLSQVKLSELGSWISRRNKSPRAAAGAVSRGKRISLLCCIFEKLNSPCIANLLVDIWHSRHTSQHSILNEKCGNLPPNEYNTYHSSPDTLK
jgi:hypothetical protein